MIVQRRATVDDLYQVEGPAELINGRIIPSMTGDRPSEIGFNIAVDLRGHSKKTKRGKVRCDGIGYVVPELPSGRESFSPDVSYHTRKVKKPMRFVEGAPDYAGEVRSENDYGKTAERALAEKRGDYFKAGTKVVWDVDPKRETVTVYRANDPEKGTVFRKGDVVDAEPAVPGWRMKVDDIFA